MKMTTLSIFFSFLCLLSSPSYSMETKGTLPDIYETEEGLVIETESHSHDKAIFTAAAVLVARCVAHPACRATAASSGQYILRYVGGTVAGGLTWDWANKELCGGSCYDLIFE